jgi:isopentenyl diphosphate isomerase/L-lactate dehydrogenase-like FMN-dependent dehydrogenase
MSTLTRRGALGSLLGVPALHGQSPLPGDLANVFEMRDLARRKLPPDVYATIAGSEDRRAFDRRTFLPRLMINVAKLDLSLKLMGDELFAPMLVGPVSNQSAFHPEAEIEMVRGAAAAKSVVVVSNRSSRKLPDIIAEAKAPVWFQIYPDAQSDVTVAAARNAVESGCRAVFLTVGVQPPKTATKLDWPIIGRLRQALKVPLLLKGIMNAEEARLAISQGVDGIAVSNHGGIYTSGFAEPIEMLPSIAEAVNGKVPVLIDGGFRRGTDILKALALGAKAVLLARPPVWGLAAYGAEGVQRVLEMLQTELARSMALCGKPDLKSIDRSLVRLHKR